ncbi:hypothetical protein [Rhizobium sp. AN80A]|uniref:hypothetical protein n=1 Tax=unclassified Rhizobium TaxID=2613769 RepID=UPI0013AEE92D|nr:hypothetical protein [Rhizobium sp. AN80A]
MPIIAADPELVRVLPDRFNFDLETWVVMHEGLRGSARCRIVFDVLVEELKKLALSCDGCSWVLTMRDWPL